MPAGTAPIPAIRTGRALPRERIRRMTRLGAALAVLLAVPACLAQESPYGPGDVYGNVPPIDDRGRDQLAMFRTWNPDPVGNEERLLLGVRPELGALVRKVRADNPALPFVVGSGLRSEAEQRQAQIWGWSPGRRRGARSPHGRSHVEGRAVDLWPLDGDGRVTFDPLLQARLGAAVRSASRELAIALSWGGAWRRPDPSHFELRR